MIFLETYLLAPNNPKNPMRPAWPPLFRARSKQRRKSAQNQRVYEKKLSPGRRRWSPNHISMHNAWSRIEQPAPSRAGAHLRRSLVGNPTSGVFNPPPPGAPRSRPSFSLPPPTHPPFPRQLCRNPTLVRVYPGPEATSWLRHQYSSTRPRVVFHFPFEVSSCFSRQNSSFYFVRGGTFTFGKTHFFFSGELAASICSCFFNHPRAVAKLDGTHKFFYYPALLGSGFIREIKSQMPDVKIDFCVSFFRASHASATW